MDKTPIAEAAVLDCSQQQAPSLGALDDSPYDEAALVTYLRLEPGPLRTAGQIRRCRVLPYVPFDPSSQHFLPGFVSAACQPAHGEDEVGAIHEPFQYATTLLQRSCPEITAASVEDVEGDEDRPSRRHVRAKITEQIERDTSWSSNTATSPSSTRGGPGSAEMALTRSGNRGSVLDALPANKAHVASNLVGAETPAINLFLVDPTGAVEGLDEHRLDEVGRPRASSSSKRRRRTLWREGW
jgi:hypothetical protein